MGNITELPGLLIGVERSQLPNMFQLDDGAYVKIDSLKESIIVIGNRQLVQKAFRIPDNMIEQMSKQIFYGLDQKQKKRLINNILAEEPRTIQSMHQETKKTYSQIQPNDPVVNIKSLEAITKAFKDSGITIGWAEKSSMGTSLSLPLMLGTIDDDIQCEITHRKEERFFEELMTNPQTLNQYYNDMNKTTQDLLGTGPKNVTVLEFNKGSVKTMISIKADQLLTFQRRGKMTQIRSDYKFTFLTNRSRFRLSVKMLDSKGNRNYSYVEMEQDQKKFYLDHKIVGGLSYRRPDGCLRFGLNVWNKYQNNEWLCAAMAKDRWATCYHGVSQPGKVCLDNNNAAQSILGDLKLKAGPRQMCGNNSCIRHCKATPKCPSICQQSCKSKCKIPEKGVYLTPDYTTALKFAKQQIQGQKGKIQYGMVIMCKVKPSEVHIPTGQHDYWCVGQDYIRPYGFIVPVRQNA